MDQEKRKILVREIEHWRRSKLLPEHYCDFLMNLYADDTAASTMQDPQNRKSFSELWVSSKNVVYALTFFTVIAIVGLNFTAFPLSLQLALPLLLIGAIYAVGFALRKSQTVASYALLGIGTLILLVAGPMILRLHGVDTPGNIGLYIAVCGVLWIILGLATGLRMFHFCGWIGLSLVYAWVLYQRADEWPWWLLHAVWIPIVFLFCWIAWASRRYSPAHSKVLLATAALQWWIPDGLHMMINGVSGLAQGILVAKVVIAGGLGLFLRTRWRNVNS